MDFHSFDATSIGASLFVIAIISAVIFLFSSTDKRFGGKKGEKVGEKIFILVAFIAFCGMIYGIFR